MSEHLNHLKLRIMTPEGILAETECDDVQLVLPDGSDGQGGGSIGIRYGHESAILALADSEAEAEEDGHCILRAHVHGGFASVEDNIVTVLSNQAELEE